MLWFYSPHPHRSILPVKTFHNKSRHLKDVFFSASCEQSCHENYISEPVGSLSVSNILFWMSGGFGAGWTPGSVTRTPGRRPAAFWSITATWWRWDCNWTRLLGTEPGARGVRCLRSVHFASNLHFVSSESHRLYLVQRQHPINDSCDWSAAEPDPSPHLPEPQQHESQAHRQWVKRCIWLTELIKNQEPAAVSCLSRQIKTRSMFYCV